MSYPAKKERNARLWKLRVKKPEEWSYGKLGEEFNIKPQTAHEIFVREQAKRQPVVDKS